MLRSVLQLPGKPASEASKRQRACLSNPVTRLSPLTADMISHQWT